MVERRVCTFCGDEIEPGTGKMYIKKDGVVYNFCSSKCYKNLVILGRVPRRTTWTRYYEREKSIRMKGAPVPEEKPKAKKVKKEEKPVAEAAPAEKKEPDAAAKAESEQAKPKPEEKKAEAKAPAKKAPAKKAEPKKAEGAKTEKPKPKPKSAEESKE
jgi:large subunit ribosomal protein L24e